MLPSQPTSSNSASSTSPPPSGDTETAEKVDTQVATAAGLAGLADNTVRLLDHICISQGSDGIGLEIMFNALNSIHINDDHDDGIDDI